MTKTRKTLIIVLLMVMSSTCFPWCVLCLDRTSESGTDNKPVRRYILKKELPLDLVHENHHIRPFPVLRLTPDSRLAAMTFPGKPGKKDIIENKLEIISPSLYFAEIKPGFKELDILPVELAGQKRGERKTSLLCEFSPDGTKLAVIDCLYSLLWIIDVKKPVSKIESGNPVYLKEIELCTGKRLKPFQFRISGIAWYKDGAFLLVVSAKGGLWEISIENPTQRRCLLSYNRFKKETRSNNYFMDWHEYIKPEENHIPVYFWIVPAQECGGKFSGGFGDLWYFTFNPLTGKITKKPGSCHYSDPGLDRISHDKKIFAFPSKRETIRQYAERKKGAKLTQGQKDFLYMMKNLYRDKKDELPDNAFYIFNNSVRECINIIPGKVYAQRWSPSGRSIVVLIREKGGPLYIQIAGY